MLQFLRDAFDRVTGRQNDIEYLREQVSIMAAATQALMLSGATMGELVDARDAAVERFHASAEGTLASDRALQETVALTVAIQNR